MRRLPMFLFTLFAFLCFAAFGCDDTEQAPDDASPAATDGTVADHDIELPADTASLVPFPADASIMNVSGPEDGETIIVYRPGMSMQDAIDFFSTGFSSDGWTITDENLPDADDDGEIGASWDVEGHGVEIESRVSGFGDITTTRVTATMKVTAQ